MIEPRHHPRRRGRREPIRCLDTRGTVTPMTAAADTRPCGHSKYPTRTGITVRRLVEVTESNATHFMSITGGERTLTATRCTCGQVSYSLRERGAAPKAIGDDPDIVAAALHAIVAQPVDVFVMELYPNRPISVIVPRHHLPLMIVEDER